MQSTTQSATLPDAVTTPDATATPTTSTTPTTPTTPPPALTTPVPPLSALTRSLDAARSLVEKDDAGKWDAPERVADLSVHRDRLCFPAARDRGHGEGLPLSPWAFGQLCERVKAPAAYLRRLPADLSDANLAHGLKALEAGRRLNAPDRNLDRDATWLLRCKGARVRAVLSGRYARLDNARVLDALSPLVSDPRYRVALAQVTDTALHLRLIDGRVAREVLKGDPVFAGVCLTNSEVGAHACAVEALVWRQVCTNGLVRKVGGRSLLRQRHFAVSESRFADSLDAALREAAAAAAGLLGRLTLAVATPVPDPERALERLGKAWDLTEDLKERALFALHGEAAPETLYGLVNALTGAARALPVGERLRVEALAATLIDAPEEGGRLRPRVLAAPATTTTATTATTTNGKE